MPSKHIFFALLAYVSSTLSRPVSLSIPKDAPLDGVCTGKAA